MQLVDSPFKTICIFCISCVPSVWMAEHLINWCSVYISRPLNLWALICIDFLILASIVSLVLRYSLQHCSPRIQSHCTIRLFCLYFPLMEVVHLSTDLSWTINSFYSAVDMQLNSDMIFCASSHWILNNIDSDNEVQIYPSLFGGFVCIWLAKDARVWGQFKWQTW